MGLREKQQMKQEQLERQGRESEDLMEASMEPPAVDLGAPLGVSVYKRVSNHGTGGQYNCYLQTWDTSGWTNTDTNIVVVRNVRESSGHQLGGSSRFLAVGKADSNGRVPVVPLGYAHAY